MIDFGSAVKEMSSENFRKDYNSITASSEPVLIRGLVSDWPVVKAGLHSDSEIVSYIKRFYTGKTVVRYKANAEKNGRFFYNSDLSELDFESGYVKLTDVLNSLERCKLEQNPSTHYVGSTSVDVCLPGFREENNLGLDLLKPLVSIWLGNRSVIAAHFDAPDNIACCIGGKRRFTLLPPEQIGNLYVGPLDFTPSGQAISLVDFRSPDLVKYPKFKCAMSEALVAELDAGDALFIPSMWWHHVESLSDINALVNYWWRSSEQYMDLPLNVLHYAMLSIRDLPQKEKDAWKQIFNHYIFEPQEGRYEYIPDRARGFLSRLDNLRARKLRAWLLNVINK